MGGADVPLAFVSIMILGRKADGVWEAPSALVWEAGGPPEARGAQCSTYKEACWPALAMAEKADE